ncbi:MAG: 2-amino-4-hydroxy-6-hydroxymethyldihydropteridine diphosphokinase [Saprospiraceae bacterium]
MPMEAIFLGLGSNVDPKEAHLSQAINEIAFSVGPILQCSSLYRTKAWGKTDQSDFINQVIKIESSLSALVLLDTILFIESVLGKVRQGKWGPRKIDIDILFYGQTVITTERLIVPHPFVQDRNFVLVPMMEIAPDFVHPLQQLSIKELYEKCEDKLWVERIAAL